MLGLIPTKWDLALCNDVTASSFCRRRLPVIMVKNKMCGSVRMATKFIQQGHVRVGPQVVKDPAFIVARYIIFTLHKWGEVRIITAATNACILPIL
jgi:U3 small nucleolar ribonucleoprotein protein IMP3